MKLHLFAKTGENERFRISSAASGLRILTAAGSGVLMALAFPPCNAEVLAFAALAPLIALAAGQNWRKAAFSGWLWGMGWSLCAFWWLREIHPAIPFGIAPVISLWSALFAAGIPFLFRYLLHPPETILKGYSAMQAHQPGILPQTLFATGAAAWWCCVDVLRAEMFPWNYLAATQYRTPALLQIAEYTGNAGPAFLIVLVNAALALALVLAPRAAVHGRYPRPWVFLGALLLTVVCGTFGLLRIRQLQTMEVKGKPVRFGLVQGDISQRRVCGNHGAAEALTIYVSLTRELLKQHSCDLAIWPETAVPYPLYAFNPVSALYRTELKSLLQEFRTPMLIGTLHYVPLANGSYGQTNSAFLLTGKQRPQCYHKIHRVPFGEFIPFRKYLPEKLTDAIDMQRDLTPGVDPSPLPVAPQTRAGIAICYESVFADLARREALRGANLLLILTNDAWYPTSSEPEQHLANAVVRSIETRLPSLRCGNNGGTLLVGRTGIVEKTFPTGITGRGRAYGVLSVTPEATPKLTFHTRYGEVFQLLCAIFAAAVFLTALLQCRRTGRLLHSCFEPEKRE